MLQLKRKDLNRLVMIGDRVLIKPTEPVNRTESGLYLPQGMHRSEELRTGYVIKVGPGYPVPMVQDIDEPWKEERENVKYVSLQASPGDMAVYLQKNVFEIVFNKEEYVIASHAAILLVVREDELR